MNYNKINSISLVYGDRKKMKEFINYFHEFWERDGEKLRILGIKNNRHSQFKDLKKLIWKGD